MGLFHCIQRCVRRAWLCGQDPYTGENYDHRKVQIRQRLEFLAGQFGIDVCSYAVMTNHLHVILRNRPDIVSEWSGEEVARRWWNLFPARRDEDGNPEVPYDHELKMLMADAKVLTERRERLGSTSWFMRCLAEPIARQANKEDECTGRFWEGRFKCQPLLDETAILACSVYVDLNPIRAKVADAPETSEFTSAHDRIHARRARQGKPRRRYRFSITPRDNWLAPIELAREAGSTPSGTGKRASNKGFLPMKLAEYLRVVEWTGRQIARGKAGSIPRHLAPLFERVDLDPAFWVEMVRNYKRWFRSAAGTPASLALEATRRGQSWLQCGSATVALTA